MKRIRLTPSHRHSVNPLVFVTDFTGYCIIFGVSVTKTAPECRIILHTLPYPTLHPTRGNSQYLLRISHSLCRMCRRKTKKYFAGGEEDLARHASCRPSCGTLTTVTPLKPLSIPLLKPPHFRHKSTELSPSDLGTFVFKPRNFHLQTSVLLSPKLGTFALKPRSFCPQTSIPPYFEVESAAFFFKEFGVR